MVLHDKYLVIVFQGSRQCGYGRSESGHHPPVATLVGTLAWQLCIVVRRGPTTSASNHDVGFPHATLAAPHVSGYLEAIHNFFGHLKLCPDVS
jgi:hypothetical protein